MSFFLSVFILFRIGVPLSLGRTKEIIT